MFQLSEIMDWFNSHYSLGEAISSELIRSYTNDVYRIQVCDNQYVLKVYGLGWRTEVEIQYEVALLDHLKTRRVRVTNAIAGEDGRIIYSIPTSSSGRFAVLFEYAEGKKPQPPFSETLYYRFGEAIGHMHHFSDDFLSQYSTKWLDLDTVLDEPLNLALPLITTEADRLFLQQTGDIVRTKLTELSVYGLDRGPIHGDATLDNLHVTDDGQIILYDFDIGGPGWRAADLQGWAKNDLEYQEKWDAYKAGYASVRELREIDLEAAPYMAIAWLIWGLQIDLERRVLAQGSDKVGVYLKEQIDNLRQEASLIFG